MKQAATIILVTLGFALGAGTMWAMQADRTQPLPEMVPSMAPGFDPWTSVPMAAPVFPSMELMSGWPTEMLMLTGPGNDITRHEDGEHIYFTIDVGASDVSRVDVKTDNGYLTIDAEMSSRTGNSYKRSGLHRMMPIPAVVDADTIQVLNEGEQIVIRMDKNSTARG